MSLSQLTAQSQSKQPREDSPHSFRNPALSESPVQLQRQSIAPNFALGSSLSQLPEAQLLSTGGLRQGAARSKTLAQSALANSASHPQTFLSQHSGGRSGGPALQSSLDVEDITLRFSEQVPIPNPLDSEAQPFCLGKRGEAADKCGQHVQEFILFCLKCQEKICTKCLDTNHLLHPVVPLNSVNKLDFKKSLQKEIEKSLEDIRSREGAVHAKIGADLKKHKIALRSHIIGMRDQLREDFDAFFNQMLSCVR
mmetsp:Transcript_15751/g.26574  ORF Transcript_15751/g.26574 Transcript_15751/m.26574 type:complete len:253 (+) Transcript_15751:551-1309(+)